MSTHLVQDELEQQESVRQSVEEPLAASKVIPSVAPTRYRALFEDSLLETGSRHRRRRTWPTILSFVLQCFLVSVLVLVPLWYTDVLPRQQLVTFLVAPPPPPPPPPPAPAVAKIIKVASDLLNGQLRTPSSIPSKVEMLKEAEAPPADVTGGVLGGVPGGIPGGQLGGVIGGIISSTSNLAAVPKLSKPAPTAQRVRVSQGVTQGMLTYKVQPEYPPIARQARIQGVVVLRAIVDKDGNIQNLELVSGHPMLAPAAIDAVKQWRYKPYLLNGLPVEVETMVTVTFQLQQ